ARTPQPSRRAGYHVVPAVDSPRPCRPSGALMANLTEAEFGRAVRALIGHFGLERLRDRFAKMGAFTSRRGLNTPEALADRLYQLSGGLRRQAVPSFAFTSLW